MYVSGIFVVFQSQTESNTNTMRNFKTQYFQLGILKISFFFEESDTIPMSLSSLFSKLSSFSSNLIKVKQAHFFKKNIQTHTLTFKKNPISHI